MSNLASLNRRFERLRCIVEALYIPAPALSVRIAILPPGEREECEDFLARLSQRIPAGSVNLSSLTDEELATLRQWAERLKQIEMSVMYG